MTVKILALDTATENCSVALLTDDGIYFRSEVAPRDHTKKILPMVDDVLKEAGLSLNDLDALAFGRGPGSFTGVRIGIGIAQGLAFGADLPMIGISTLEAMAQGVYRKHGESAVATAIDARMSEIYWGRFLRQEDGSWLVQDAECVISPALVVEKSIDDENTWFTAGTGWEAYSDLLTQLPFRREISSIVYPDAQDIVSLAKIELLKGNTVSVEEASPVYLRDKVTWKKLPGRE